MLGLSLDLALLGIVAVLGIYDGLRVRRLPVFVPEPLGSGAYLIGLSVLLLLAIATEIALHPAARASAARIGPGRVLAPLRDVHVQAWLALVLYAVLLPLIGYFVSTLCYLLLSVRLFGERRWVWVAVTSGALTVTFYLLFQRLAGMALP